MLCLMCLSSSFFLGNAMIITSKMIIRNRIGMEQDVLVKCRIYFFWMQTKVYNIGWWNGCGIAKRGIKPEVVEFGNK